MKEQLLTPTDVARILLVSPVTVRQWAQKGWIDYQSTPGGHRRFTLEAVQRFAAQRGLTLAPQEQRTTAASTLRILIVEDDALLRSFLVDLFSTRKQEIIIDTAESGFEAGLKLQAFAPHIVLLDLMLPGMDGVAVCKQIKAAEQTRAIRVIAMTGYYTNDNIQKMVAAGAETCLRKPLDIDMLMAACEID